MMNMKEMNRELTMEELETVSGGVLPEEMTKEQLEEYIRNWVNHQDLAELRSELLLQKSGLHRRIVATRMHNPIESYRSRYL